MKTYIILDKEGYKFNSISHIEEGKITSLRSAIELAKKAEKEEHKKACIWRKKEDGGYSRVIF